MLHLIRHGRPEPVPGIPRSDWALSPAAVPEVHRLGDSGVLPASAVWFASSERRAVETARLLHDGEITIREDLREQVRPAWVNDFGAAIERAVMHPDRPAHAGWERAIEVTRRVTQAVRSITDRSDGDVALSGHGFAWMLLVAALTGDEPDLASWHDMKMPDHCALDEGRISSRWGEWLR